MRVEFCPPALRTRRKVRPKVGCLLASALTVASENRAGFFPPLCFVAGLVATFGSPRGAGIDFQKAAFCRSATHIAVGRGCSLVARGSVGDLVERPETASIETTQPLVLTWLERGRAVPPNPSIMRAAGGYGINPRRHRCDAVPGTAPARWRAWFTPSAQADARPDPPPTPSLRLEGVRRRRRNAGGPSPRERRERREHTHTEHDTSPKSTQASRPWRPTRSWARGPST